MRMLTLPAAFALAFPLYLACPKAAGALCAGLSRLFARLLRLFTDRRGRTDRAPALAVFLLALGGVCALLCAAHPVLCALAMAPLFTALRLVPESAAVKRRLDGGALLSDVPAYEALVRKTCEEFAPAFATGAFLPLLLCALGLPLWLGGALGWMATGLRAADGDGRFASRVLPPLDRLCDALLHGLLLLCSCLVGRNPFRTRGKNAQERLMSLLGIAPDEDIGGHAPVAGDIAQAAFVCCFCACLFCLMLTLLLLPLTR